MTVVTSTLALEEVNPVATKSSPDHSPAKAYPPPRLIPTSWPTTQLGPSEVLTFVSPRLRGVEGSKRRAVARRGLVRMLDFLGEHPGDTWQQRWVASGADSAGDDWAQGPAQWLERTGLFSASRLAAMTASLPALIGADVIRPTLRWLLTGGKKRKMTTNLIRSRDPQGFAAIASECQRDPELGAPAELPTSPSVIFSRRSKSNSMCEARCGRGRPASRCCGSWGSSAMGCRPCASCVALPGPRSKSWSIAIRSPLVLCAAPSSSTSRNASPRWTTARCATGLTSSAAAFDSLRLDAEVASAWKQRLHTRPPRSSGEATQSSVERLSYLDVLAAVRAFYLDVAEWALDDPARWAQWVAPCPISPQELTRRKAVRRRKARMDARTRERLPVLPVLVRTVDEWRRHSAALLVAARSASPGETFSVDDVTLVRAVRPHAATANVWADDPRTGEHRSLSQEEERAFWAWAVIEVLRSTGLRVEELLELSHYSLVQYRLPTSGELVPLLQIAPSKTDAERVIVVGPELSEVLSSIILRIRDGGAAVPLVRARDRNEQVWLPAAPLLFQRRRGAEHHAISGATVSALLDEALARSGLVDLEGAPLRCTPHDFRRIFITDAIRSGLPPHIAQIVAGHHNINVTMGYNAVYPDDAIQAHLAFLARRRALRPNEEYRTPTDEEWEEFLGHFERRKVSIGTCGRSFGSPCIHEHACVRCSMLWPDPSQRHRLVEIRDNLVARIAEARTEGWLGEIEGLEVSLAGAEEKLTQMERRAVKAVPVTLRRD
jgi:integrase